MIVNVSNLLTSLSTKHLIQFAQELPQSGLRTASEETSEDLTVKVSGGASVSSNLPTFVSYIHAYYVCTVQTTNCCIAKHSLPYCSKLAPSRPAL